MKSKIFTNSISVGGSYSQYNHHVSAKSYDVPQMDTWLVANPNIVGRSMAQSHTYHKGNYVVTDAIVVITTVFYEEKVEEETKPYRRKKMAKTKGQ